MQQTSLQAYWSLSQEKISKRQQQVLDALSEIQPATNRMISEASRIPINVVTPRMGELRKKGRVEEGEISVDATGRKAIFWKVKEA